MTNINVTTINPTTVATSSTYSTDTTATDSTSSMDTTNSIDTPANIMQAELYLESIKVNSSIAQELLNTDIDDVVANCIDEYVNIYTKLLDKEYNYDYSNIYAMLINNPSIHLPDLEPKEKIITKNFLKYYQQSMNNHFNSTQSHYTSSTNIRYLINALDLYAEFNSSNDPLEFFNSTGKAFLNQLTDRIVEVLEEHYSSLLYYN